MQLFIAMAVLVSSLLSPHVPHGIAGQVTIGPTLPLCLSAPCLPRAYQTTLTISGHGRTVIVETGTDGRYAVKVAPGTYTVTGCGRGIFSRTDAVTVSSRGFATANLACDTGLR